MEMIEVKTVDLVGDALDWAVAQVEGVNYRQDGIKCKTRIAPRKWHHYTKSNFSPSTDWSWGGPLIEKYQVRFDHRRIDCGLVIASACGMIYDHAYKGCDSYLVAACRAIVAAKLGDTVSVPKELMQ